MSLVVHPTLYTIDSAGKVRTWRMETEGGKHRAVAGVEGGKEVTSTWSVCEAKNVGRSNATTPEEQALLEVESLYKKKRDRKYHDDRSKVGGAKFFVPMLAKKWADEKKKVEYPVFVQPKLDGYRCTVSIDGAMSRSGKPFPRAPHIREALEPFFQQFPDIILDGELYNHAYRDNFNEIESLVGSKKEPTPFELIRTSEVVEYHIYDCFDPNEPDATFEERIAFITVHKLNHFPMIQVVQTYICTTEEDVDYHYGSFMEQGYEGQIIRLDTPYENKRTSSLLKRKNFFDGEYLVHALEEGLGNWSGCAKSVICQDPKTGEQFKAGIKGSQEFTRQLLEEWRNVKGPDDRLLTEVTVRSPNLTPRGIPRFGVATAFYYNGQRDT